MPSKTDDKYTDPELHEQVKEEIQAGDKGGAPGQWSARKAQMMASEYKKRGGGYTKDEKDDRAKHLDEWTKEEWQTKDGDGKAKDENGAEHRYLPKKAWEQMNEEDKEATDQRKQQGSKAGKQHVANTTRAAQARKGASKHDDDEEASKGYTKIERKSVTDCTTHWDDPDYMDDNAREYRQFQEDERKSKGTSQEDHGGKKRGRGANAGCPNKKAKSSGGKQGEPTGAAGDKSRVPQKGQRVQWHALPSYVDGQVVEVVYEDKEVEGHQVKGSKEDPRVVLRSDASGKICVHKPEAVYF